MTQTEFFEFRRKIIEFLVINTCGKNPALTDDDVINVIDNRRMSRN